MKTTAINEEKRLVISAKNRARQDARLDETLLETFPASDSIAIDVTVVIKPKRSETDKNLGKKH
jgi:hypothetical protein